MGTPRIRRPHLLPRCYQDRTNQPHVGPSLRCPELWFLVGLGRLRLVCLKFVNRRSFSRIFMLLLHTILKAESSYLEGYKSPSSLWGLQRFCDGLTSKT